MFRVASRLIVAAVLLGMLLPGMLVNPVSGAAPPLSTGWPSVNTGPPASYTGPVSAPFFVVRGGPGYVAAGTVQTQPSPTPENYRAALWFSSDGAHWQPASDAGPGFGAAFFNDVVAGGPGLVAVGFAYPADGTLPVPASWTSGDGKSWRRLPLGAALGKSAGIDRVVAGRNELLALGHEAPTGLEHQIVWTSHDGLHWRRAATDPFSVGHSPPAITTLGSGFAAVGEFGNAPALWSSPDGSRWMAEAGSDIFGGGFTMLVDGAPWRNGLLVIGRRGSPPVITSSPGAQGVVFEPVAWLWTYGRDLNENVGTPQPAGNVKMAEGGTLYSVATQGFGTAHAVVWRAGRALGMVEVVGLPGGKARGVALARAQWRHWKAAGR